MKTKTILTFCLLLIASNLLLAQTFPYGINYQAVARDANGNARQNQQIPIQFTICQTSANGIIVWQERQVLTTNSMGQFNAVIGKGTPVTPYTADAFSRINWGGDSTFLKVELNNNSNFTGSFSQIGATTKFQAVPYALAAPDPTPAGVVVAFVGVSAPAGYLMCKGQAVSRTGIYAKLFATIGTAYGNGDGSTTFNVPDFRGMFLRGADSLGTNDPDATTRTSVNGGNSGTKVGSVQQDAFQGHKHASLGIAEFPTGGTMVGNLSWNFNTGSGSVILNPITDGVNGIPRISRETRPKNIYINYIIKY